MSTVNEAIARPVRGLGQSAVAVAIIEFVDALGIYTFDGRAYAASVVLLGLVLSGLQALVENRTGKSILRQLPPEAVPLADNEHNSHAPQRLRAGELGYVTLGMVVVGVLCVLGVLFVVSRL